VVGMNFDTFPVKSRKENIETKDTLLSTLKNHPKSATEHGIDLKFRMEVENIKDTSFQNLWKKYIRGCTMAHQLAR